MSEVSVAEAIACVWGREIGLADAERDHVHLPPVHSLRPGGRFMRQSGPHKSLRRHPDLMLPLGGLPESRRHLFSRFVPGVIAVLANEQDAVDGQLAAA